MTYQVVITSRAKEDLRQAYLRAAEHAPQTAARWLLRFEKALETLSTNPKRCGIAPESNLVEPEIRQYFFGKGRSAYRAFFSIKGQQVRILHIRWGGMQFATSEDLTE